MGGPCMCGDYMCPSCGPAQGFNPRFEAFCEKLVEKIPELEDNDDLQEKVANFVYDEMRELLGNVKKYVSRLTKCRTSIVGAMPPICENMTAKQALELVEKAVQEWEI